MMNEAAFANQLQPVNPYRFVDYEASAQGLPVREKVIAALRASNIEAELNTPEQSLRTPAEHEALNFVVDLLKNTMVAALLRLPLDVMDIPSLELWAEEQLKAEYGESEVEALYDHDTNTIILNKTVIEHLYAVYAEYLETKFLDHTPTFEMAKSALAPKVAELMVAVVNQLAHELSHAYDRVHQPEQARASIDSIQTFSRDPKVYLSDQGEISAEELRLDVVQDVLVFTVLDQEVAEAVETRIDEEVRETSQLLTLRKHVRRQFLGTTS